MNKLVSLPMYDLACTRDATADWWQGLRKHLLAHGVEETPDELARPGDVVRHWLNEGLLLSQTCGYPLTHELRSKVRYLINPVYRAKGCEGPYYRSALVVRIDESGRQLDEFRTKRLAINSSDSQSGYNCLRKVLLQKEPIESSFAEVVTSGAHLQSLKLVQTGKADLCAIDCVTLALAANHQPELIEGLRILDWTPPSPGLPLITSLKTTRQTAGRIIAALHSAIADKNLDDARCALLIEEFSLVDELEFKG